jgi:erythromycin esterase
MFRRITAKQWGTQSEQIIPRDEYDGILFVDTVHPPHYIP